VEYASVLDGNVLPKFSEIRAKKLLHQLKEQ
jgi:hypothetical protein